MMPLEGVLVHTVETELGRITSAFAARPLKAFRFGKPGLANVSLMFYSQHQNPGRFKITIISIVAINQIIMGAWPGNKKEF